MMEVFNIMPDTHTPEVRAKNMSKIRARGNLSTEVKFKVLLRESKIKGWRTHYNRLPGIPDFVFPKSRVAIFLDGCFWHGCPSCFIAPVTNADYWNDKIRSNKERDRRVTKLIKDRNWKVFRVWEHELKNTPAQFISRLSKEL